MQSLRPTCNVTSCRFKAIKLLVMLGPLFGGDGPYVWPSWGKKKKQNKPIKKPVNNQMDWKLPKIKHITCKIKAWLSQETKLDVDTPSSYQFGKDVMQHRPCFPDVQAKLRQSPSQTASPSAFKRALSSFRAGAEQLPVTADCLQPEQDVSHRPLCEPNTPLAHWWTNGFGVTQVLMHRVNTLQLTKSFTLVFPTL